MGTTINYVFQLVGLVMIAFTIFCVITVVALYGFNIITLLAIIPVVFSFGVYNEMKDN